MTIPTPSGQVAVSEGQHRILKLWLAALWFGRVLERTGNQTEADLVVEAKHDFDEALASLTMYVDAHEKIAAAYAADGLGGARDDDRMETT